MLIFKLKQGFFCRLPRLLTQFSLGVKKAFAGKTQLWNTLLMSFLNYQQKSTANFIAILCQLQSFSTAFNILNFRASKTNLVVQGAVIQIKIVKRIFIGFQSQLNVLFRSAIGYYISIFTPISKQNNVVMIFLDSTSSNRDFFYIFQIFSNTAFELFDFTALGFKI